MCRPATCSACANATYTGSGQHVEQVLKDVPRNQRCTCTTAERKAGTPSFLSRLLGR